MSGLLLAQSAVDSLQHVLQHRVGTGAIKLPTNFLFFDKFTYLSNHIIMQVIAAVVVCLVVPWAVKRRAGTDHLGRLVPRGIGNAVEGICEALRTHVAKPALGPYTDQFIPYIWSAFFFVLTCNLLGMIPLGDWTKPFAGHALGGTSTGNIMVTSALAICTLGMILVNGLRLHGMNYVKHFFMGPPFLAPMIAVLEVIGLVAKTFALAMRLFANMMAGHILLAVLLVFIGMAWSSMGAVGGIAIAIPVVVGSVAINFLELFVAFLQAFIFTFLSAMFIGQAVNLHHADEHQAAEAHADSHAPAGGH